MRATGSSNFVADALHRGRLEAHLIIPAANRVCERPSALRLFKFRNFSLDQSQLFAQLTGKAGSQLAGLQPILDTGEFLTPAGKGALGAARGS